MSYNTRRTTGPANRGGPGTTQVNYHQQPTRTPATQQRANQGYTTSQQNSYTTSQPAFSTQPPLPKSTASASTPATKPPAATPTTAPTQQAKAPVPVPATPVVKAEPITPVSTPKMDTDVTAENGQGEGPKFAWKKRPFVKVSNKVKRARMNAKLRRALNPKNAITFLNELRPGNVKFNVREAPGWGYTATTDIDGNTYSGHALSIAKAKMLASEHALKSIMLDQINKAPPLSKADIKEESDVKTNDESMETDDGEGEPKAKKGRFEEDEIPWGSLAAFALHKLFAEWHRESGESEELERFDEDTTDELFTRRPGPPAFGYHAPMRFPGPPFAPRGRGFGGFPRGPAPGFRRPPPPANAFLKGPSRPAKMPNSQLPMKKIPDDANQRHPVMLLNQLNPNVSYREEKEGAPPNVMFKVFVNIDGNDFEGTGCSCRCVCRPKRPSSHNDKNNLHDGKTHSKSKKDAKKEAAKAALAPLGIVYQGE